MSIRFSILSIDTEAPEDDVIVGAYHVDTTGGWFEHPIRDHALRSGYKASLLAHVALGFLLHRGPRRMLTVSITHDDPSMDHGLEVVSLSPVLGESVFPGADAPAAAVAERFVIPPGGSATFQVLHSHVRIRESAVFRTQFDEVLMSEVPSGDAH